MQIRELTLKELDTAWELVKQLRTSLEYDEFEDLIYEMREINYTMIGIFEQDRIVAYAGVNVSTNLVDKRHLYVSEFIVDNEVARDAYEVLLQEYLEDYAKMAACESILFHKAAN